MTDSQTAPFTVASLDAIEVLDSRGRPTLSVTAVLGDGTRASAGVPSGASTGRREAVERRDRDPRRYRGLGVLTAVANVRRAISGVVAGQEFADLGELDAAVTAADGTADKSGFGANAIVGVSMAVARALACSRGEPLWRTLAGGDGPRLPMPHFNVLNGGAHAANPLEFQEFMLAPLGASSFADAVQMGAEVYGRLRELLVQRGMSVGLGDEGGFAPDVSLVENVLQLLVDAIGAAGYSAGPDGVAIALDPAANGFFADDRYHLDGRELSAEEMVDRYERIIGEFPVWSIEDGLAEDDWDGWKLMTERLGGRVQVMGDDIFVTDPATIAKAASMGVANSSLIKVNQIGTVTETLEALATCRRVGYSAMISHRSGETPDPFIADLAVASGCGQIKSGAPARGERVAKYNRLLEIAADNPGMAFGLPADAPGRAARGR